MANTAQIKVQNCISKVEPEAFNYYRFQNHGVVKNDYLCKPEAEIKNHIFYGSVNKKNDLNFVCSNLHIQKS
ncbi:MAG: hypothetical protein QM800_04335 [Paludibacter sp.]